MWSKHSEHRRTSGRGESRGATAVEYGLLVALIAGVIVAFLVAFGPQVQGLLDLTF